MHHSISRLIPLIPRSNLGTAIVLTMFWAVYVPTSPVLAESFSENLSPGARGAAVSELQMFLKEDKAIYPEAIVSGWFGPLTKRALIRFQKKHGISPAAGFFGPLSRAKARFLALGTIPAASPMFYGGGAVTTTLKREVKNAEEIKGNSCSITPFSHAISPGEKVAYIIALKSSHAEPKFILTTGTLPMGIAANFSKGNMANEVKLVLSTSQFLQSGSFGIAVIYDELEGDDMARRSFCQLNVVVE